MFSLIQKSGAFSKRPGSHFALAVALATGTAMTAGVFAVPAQAQDEEAKPEYSKAFVEAYRPMQELVNAEPADQAAIQAALPAVMAAVETNDDRNVAGNLAYRVGRDTDNVQLQLRGLDLMVQSGNGGPDRLGQLYFTQFQLNRDAGNVAAARTAAEGAIGLNYSFNGNLADGTTKRFRPDDIRLMVAELYFAEDNAAGGLEYLDQAITGKAGAGEQVPRDWLRRGLAQAYNNDMNVRAISYSAMYVEHYPGEESWGDAINILRNLNRPEKGELLDLLRLARRVDVLRSAQDYEDYVEAADARLLPGEVDTVIKEGQSRGLISGENMFIADAREASALLIVDDRRGLPELERDALASGANLRTITAAGDVFLSYGQYAKAENFFRLALQQPGVNADEVNNRLGIVQVELGKYSQAIETFAKVQSSRLAIVRLWSIYAEQKAAATAAARPAPTPAVEPANEM